MACGSCSSGGGCGCSSGLGGYSSCGDGCPSVKIFDWLPTSTKQPYVDHYEYVQVAFKARRTKIYHNKSQLSVYAGDHIIVTVPHGVDFGRITMTGELARLRAGASKPKGIILRLASDKDIKRHENNRLAEADDLITAQRVAERHKIPIKIADIEWQFDRKKISLYYTTSKKKSLDFRKLLGALRHQYKPYKARVELHRLSPRHETARIGGVGVCGRELCCSTWMQAVKRVSFDAAKKQFLPLKPDRLYGRCNQLKCCLNFELNHYMAVLKSFPKRDARVKTPDGIGLVRKIDIFSRSVLVEYEGNRVPEYVSVEQLAHLPQRKSRKAKSPA